MLIIFTVQIIHGICTSQYRKARNIYTVTLDIELGKHPSWNIPNIPRAGAASGLCRPLGCLEYFTRDAFLVQYREILHSAKPRVIFPDIALYIVTRCCAPHDNIQCNIRGNSVISLAFLYWLVNIPYNLLNFHTAHWDYLKSEKQKIFVKLMCFFSATSKYLTII